MNKRLTVSQARQLTGKSESTIKRMIREIASNPSHPDRDLIVPSATEIQQLKANRRPYVWRIAEELLSRRFLLSEANDEDSSEPASSPQVEQEIAFLKQQLSNKDAQFRALEKQLEAKDLQIQNLNERHRESNVLMKNLQEHFAIAPPRNKRPLLSRLLGK